MNMESVNEVINKREIKSASKNLDFDSDLKSILDQDLRLTCPSLTFEQKYVQTDGNLPDFSMQNFIKKQV